MDTAQGDSAGTNHGVTGHRAIRSAYGSILEATPLSSRQVSVDGRDVHLVETGAGRTVLFLHGTGSTSLFFHQLLTRLPGCHVVAPDRPGQGLSDSIPIPRAGFRDAAVTWIERMLETLGLDRVVLGGHSMGGLWSLWFALAHPDRVERLVLLGPPQLPGTRVPVPFRVLGTPGLGRLVQRLAPPNPASMQRFAAFLGEGESLPQHPDLVDLLVAAGGDPDNAATDLNEVRAIVSSMALLSPRGFRRSMTVRPDELRDLHVPTLLVWGEQEPLGSPSTAQQIVDHLPRGQLALLPGGHAPWLDDPDGTASAVADFLA